MIVDDLVMEIMPSAYSKLQKFYAPFNIKLAEMLSDRRYLEWGKAKIHRKRG